MACGRLELMRDKRADELLEGRWRAGRAETVHDCAVLGNGGGTKGRGSWRCLFE
jgi:hypothetical protein